MPARYLGNARKMTSKPTVIRNVFVDLSRTELPALVGGKLTRLVTDSLCCLDAGEDDVGDAHNGSDGFAAGMGFMGNVLVELNSISI